MKDETTSPMGFNGRLSLVGINEWLTNHLNRRKKSATISTEMTMIIVLQCQHIIMMCGKVECKHQSVMWIDSQESIICSSDVITLEEW